MFVVTLLALSCIFESVKSNPLQGFSSYPVIQYEGSYRNEQPLFVHPNDYNSYPHLHLIQNQLTPYQNIPVSYNDIVKTLDLENILKNQIISAITTNCGQPDLSVNSASKHVPNIVNNYIIVPADMTTANGSYACSNRTVKSKSQIIENVKQKKKKCRKKKKTTKNSNGNKEKDSNGKRNSRRKKCNKVSKQSEDQVEKVCKKKISRSKLENKNTSPDSEYSADKEKHGTGKKYNKNCKASCNEENMLKRMENNQNPPNIFKNDESYDSSQIQKYSDYFKIDEECTELNNRCTRNYREENVQNYQQPYYLPSDFSSNVIPYTMFDQQLFDINGYFPYNFDYLYKMQQPNPSQKKTNKNQRKGKKKKQKKEQQQKQDSVQNGDCKKIVELSPNVIDGETRSEIVSTIISTTDKLRDNSDINRKKIDETLTIQDNSKEINPNNCFDLNQEDYSSIYDDYYPQFLSDNVYTSKEEFDWDNFNYRHYYTSNDINELDRERRKYDSLNDATITSENNIIESNNVKDNTCENIEAENWTKQEFSTKKNNKDHNDNVKPKTSSEEIQFKTPPALDFPDFKTEMVNKDSLIPNIEIYHQPNNKQANANKHKKNKMSTYSDKKISNSNERINKIVSQNEVETVFGHSKVVKYGAPPKEDEYNINISDDLNDDNNSFSRDDGPIIVIAKSLPYPID